MYKYLNHEEILWESDSHIFIEKALKQRGSDPNSEPENIVREISDAEMITHALVATAEQLSRMTEVLNNLIQAV